jgi:predicted aspartyl protease
MPVSALLPCLYVARYAGLASFAILNPQVAPWATICRRLRRLGFRVADAVKVSTLPGLEPISKRVYELADEREMAFDVGLARIEVKGEVPGDLALFGNDNAEPLLGVTALESVGIEVDPKNQHLERLPAVLRLK